MASASDRGQEAGNKIKDVLDDAFATILQDGVGQFDRLFLELNTKFETMQTEIVGMRQHIATLEDEREKEGQRRQAEIDQVVQALTGSVETLGGKHSQLEQMVDQKIQEVEWRADQKIEARLNGVNEQKQRELAKRVMYRLRMKWVFLTFESWKGEWEAVHAEKKAIQTAAMKFFRTSMVYAFNTWRAHTVGEAKKKEVMSTQANFERIGRIEEAMKLEVEQRFHEIGTVNTVLKQLEMLIESRDQAEAKRRHADIDRKLRRTLVKITMGALSNCFDAWRAFYEEKKEQKTLLRKISNMMMKKGVTLCFGAWQKWAQLEVKERGDAAKIATASTNFEAITALAKTVEEHKVNLETLIDTKSEDLETRFHIQLDTKLNALMEGMSMKEANEKEARALKHQRNVLMRMLQRCMVQAFDAWKGKWEEKKGLERKLKTAVALFSKLPMVKCFRAWQMEWRTQHGVKAVASVQANFERLGELETKEKELEAALQAETEQRFYEAEQVSKVLQHLEKVFGTTFDTLNSKQEAHVEALKQSGLRAIMYRMSASSMGQAFEAWRLGIEAFKQEKIAQAREKNVMEKMVFMMNGNKKGQAFMSWKQEVARRKNEETHQRIYDLTTLSTKVDKHDKMFIQFAKTFRLIPENVSEMMQTGSPQSSSKGGGGGGGGGGRGGVEEGTPPSGR
jgi:hypothetical protein